AGGRPRTQGGRSNGAGVACRAAAAVGARAVIALASPLHPPGRAAGPGQPDRSRAAELAAAGTDVLVVNGDRDPFGIPEGGGKVRVMVLAGGSHALCPHPAAGRGGAGGWLGGVVAPGGVTGWSGAGASGGAWAPGGPGAGPRSGRAGQ